MIPPGVEPGQTGMCYHPVTLRLSYGTGVFPTRFERVTYGNMIEQLQSAALPTELWEESLRIGVEPMT